jgi:signal transduction histidine kinase
MKLFTKTFFFFIFLIILQASLAIVIITNIIEKSNREDARKELTEEAHAAYENYNSWKRSIWIALMSLGKDEHLAAVLPGLSPFRAESDLFPHLKEKVLTSGIDCLVLKSEEYPYLELVPREFSMFTISDLKDLDNVKPHPYLQTTMVAGNLCLVGVTRVDRGSSALDLFMIKRIDETFCNHLVARRRSQVSFFLGDEFLAGSFQGVTTLTPHFVSGHRYAYQELYREEIDRHSYNIAMQKLGDIRVGDEDQPLLLGTFVSNLPFQRRLQLIKRTILSVSAVAFAFTAFLSIFLSRNLSRPVKNLLNAMRNVKNGRFDTELLTPPRTELGELVQGFNEMARQLLRDKTQMDAYIDEIVRLKEYSEKIIHSIRAGIVIINPELRIELVNGSFLDYFDLHADKVLGRRIDDLGIGVIDRSLVRSIRSLTRKPGGSHARMKRTPDHRVYELKMYPLTGGGGRPDGPAGRVPRTARTEVSGCVLTVEDISTKIELEEKIFQAEKLSSLSMLTAGVSHEINNPLSSIMSNVQNLIEEEEREDRRTSLKYIEQETRRIARTVRELLNFSSSVSRGERGSDVNAEIARVVNLIGYAIRKESNVTIETALEPGIPTAAIGEDELRQVIINLLNNSIQALEERGRIIISTGANRPGGTILVTVDDNGRGISEDLVPHIFDPFFTTKKNGEGTGLGLSVVYGIVKKYNGAIRVESTVGEGTRVKLELPALKNRETHGASRQGRVQPSHRR